MDRKRILLGEISSYKAITLARCLTNMYPEVQVYTYDYRKFVKVTTTRYSQKSFVITNPHNDLKQHITDLHNLIEELQIELFFPVQSDTMGEYIKNRDAFNKSFQYVGEYFQYVSLHEKDKLMKLANGLEVRTPVTFNNLDDAQYSFVAKPKDLSSSKGVYYIYTSNDLEKYYRKIKEEGYIYQEYINGIGCGFSTFSEDGQILKCYGHKRLAEYPITGGSSTYRESFIHPKMSEVAQKIISQIGWSGFAEFEFKLTPDDKLYLIEANPRIWGSINQGLQNGMNYFEPLLGEGISTDNDTEVYTYLSPLIYFSFVHYALKLNFEPFHKFLLHMKQNRADVSPFDDFKGWLSIILKGLL